MKRHRFDSFAKRMVTNACRLVILHDLTRDVSEQVRMDGRRKPIKARALMVAVLLMCLSALASLASGLVWAQDASFRVVSDGTAKYSYTEESGWETLGFDDSGWPFVVAPSGGLCDPSVAPPGLAEPIWGEDPQEFQTIFVRKTFTLEAAAVANVMVVVDDDYDLFINGVFIGGNHDGFAGNDLYTNVPLQAGLNVLAMMAIDVAGGCQWLLFDVFPPPDPPAHDDVANATVVSEVPFADGPIDTRAATAAGDDPQDCYNNGSNWYTFTPTADTSIEVNTIDSDYDTTLGVYAGSPGSLSLIECNDDFYGLQSAVRFEATANTMYYIMVGFCCGNGEAGGGTLFFNIRETPPPLDITLVVNSQGSFNHAGAATIRGTVTCNSAASFTEVYGTLRQRVGRRFITGSFYVTLDPCSPPSSRWSATVIGDGVFSGGKVTAEVFTTACDEFSCDFDSVSTTIRLKGGK